MKTSRTWSSIIACVAEGRGVGCGVVEAHGELTQGGIEASASPEPVDGPEPAGRDQPRHGPGREAIAGPVLRRGSEGVVERLLGEVEVAKEADERGQDDPAIGTVDPVDRIEAIATIRRIAGRSIAHVRRRSMTLRLEVQVTGRTSMHPKGAIGSRAAIAMASLRSRASSSRKPPSCSAVSAKGPIVVDMRPSRTRTVTASLTGSSARATMR